MSVEVRPRRSDATRAAILAAARGRFATDGYERATIRAIAADAGIDPSMVMRYFGSKEGLFAAAADFELRLPDPGAVPREDVGRLAAEYFLARWEDDGSLQALLRVGATNEAAAQRLRQIFAQQLAPMVAAVAPPGADVAARAGLVASQVLGVALTRYVLRLPPVAAMPGDELVRWVGPTLQRYFTADDPVPDASVNDRSRS
jgi:AcrR family transcriptional regulator